MSFLLLLVGLALGFVAGRFYQWVKTEFLVMASEDSDISGRHAMYDIADATRRAKEQINRVGQRRPAGR